MCGQAGRKAEAWSSVWEPMVSCRSCWVPATVQCDLMAWFAAFSGGEVCRVLAAHFNTCGFLLPLLWKDFLFLEMTSSVQLAIMEGTCFFKIYFSFVKVLSDSTESLRRHSRWRALPSGQSRVAALLGALKPFLIEMRWFLCKRDTCSSSRLS